MEATTPLAHIAAGQEDRAPASNGMQKGTTMNTSIGASSPPGYVAACMSRGMGASINWHKLERDEIAVHVAVEFISNMHHTYK